jgi:hypothetical protein
LDFITTFLSILRAILGLILIFFIPGFAFTWVIYSKRSDLSLIVRISLSCVLSIAIVMLSSLFLDFVMGIETTGLNVVITLLIITGYLIILYATRTALDHYGLSLYPTFSGSNHPLQRYFSRKFNATRDRFSKTALTAVVSHENIKSGRNQTDHYFLIDISEPIEIQQIDEYKWKVSDRSLLPPPYPTTRYFELVIREFNEEGLSMIDDLQVYPVHATMKPDVSIRGHILKKAVPKITGRIYEKTDSAEIEWIYSHDFHLLSLIHSQDTLDQMVDRVVNILDKIATSIRSGSRVLSHLEETQKLKDGFETVLIDKPRDTPVKLLQPAQQPEVRFNAEPGEINQLPLVQTEAKAPEITKGLPVKLDAETKKSSEPLEIQSSTKTNGIPKAKVVPADTTTIEISKRPIITNEPPEKPDLIQTETQTIEIPKRPGSQVSAETKKIPEPPVVQPGAEQKSIIHGQEVRTKVEPQIARKPPVIPVEPKLQKPEGQPSAKQTDIPQSQKVRTTAEPQIARKGPVIPVEPKLQKPEDQPVQLKTEPKKVPKYTDLLDDFELKERKPPALQTSVDLTRTIRPPEIQFGVELKEIFRKSSGHPSIERKKSTPPSKDQQKFGPQEIPRSQKAPIDIEPKPVDRRRLQKEILQDLDVHGITPDSFGKSKKNIENIQIPKKSDINKKLAEIQEDKEINWFELDWLYEDGQ